MAYRILVADDEREIRDLLKLYLENEKYEVIEAEDGQQALDLLRKEQVDMCLLDIMMPKVDGYHVLQELRKESNIPVIILSAKDADSEKILGLNLGADDYIAKPFGVMELVSRVRARTRNLEPADKVLRFGGLTLNHAHKGFAHLQSFFLFAADDHAQHNICRCL